MKCVHCGFFPLSPTRSICPRCGKPVQVSTSGIGRQAVDIQVQPSFSNNTPQVGVEVQAQERNATWNASQASAFRQQTPTPAAAFPPVVIQGRNTHDHGREQVFLPAQSLPEPGGYSPLFAQAGGDTAQKRSLPFGFTLSAVCVITGALILIFVYFMSLGLRTDATVTTTPGSMSAKMTVARVTPSPTAMPTTPTPTYPGQSFVDNVAMATDISLTTAKPSAPTTSFRLKQKMYVTFDVHTNHTGGICLLWYFNNRPFTTFAFAVSSSSSAYSYTYASVAGAGYVEIYWSDSASCSDPNKLLAQRAAFTVTE